MHTELIGNLVVQSANDRASVEIRHGRLVIDDGHFRSIEFSDDPSPVAEHPIYSPGFVDTHLHLPQWDIVGAHGMPLLQWLDTVTFPAELRWRDVEFARTMTARAAADLTAAGTTIVGAYATNHAASAAAAIETLGRSGIRGVVGQVLMDRGAPPGLLQPVGDQIDQTAELLHRYPPRSPLAAAVTPRFAISCGEALLRAAGELASRTGAVVQTHLAETVAECDRVAELFGGRRYVDVYEQTGLCTTTTVMGHGIHLDRSDIQTIARTGAAIAHCPTANDFLGAGSMNAAFLNAAALDAAALNAAALDARALDAAALGAGGGVGAGGARISLGSDIGAGYQRSIPAVAAAAMVNAGRLGNSMSAGRAWYLATTGGAAVLGIDGHALATGAVADWIAIRPSVPWLVDGIDPLARLLFEWREHWIGGNPSTPPRSPFA